MSKRVNTHISDINGKEVYTGDIVKMHFFSLCGGFGGATEIEHEVVGKVKVYYYTKKGKRIFCVETPNGKYPFNLKQETKEEIEILK
jgi:hypothetical protein